MNLRVLFFTILFLRSGVDLTIRIFDINLIKITLPSYRHSPCSLYLRKKGSIIESIHNRNIRTYQYLLSIPSTTLLLIVFFSRYSFNFSIFCLTISSSGTLVLSLSSVVPCLFFFNLRFFFIVCSALPSALSFWLKVLWMNSFICYCSFFIARLYLNNGKSNFISISYRQYTNIDMEDTHDKEKKAGCTEREEHIVQFKKKRGRKPNTKE